MKTFGRYLLVGLLNTGLGYAIIFGCMYGLGLSPVLSNALGYGLGMSISYFLNRSFTFRAKHTDGTTVAKFVAVNGGAYLANLGMLLFLIGTLGVHEGLAQVLAGGVYVVTSFLINKHYVFRHPHLDTKKSG